GCSNPLSSRNHTVAVFVNGLFYTLPGTLPRFPDPEGMIRDLKESGFRLGLWQLPYFNPRNRLHREAIEKEYAILNERGKPPVDDVVLDLSNPEAVRWYQGLLEKLLRQGVAAFTADFGEAAPLNGIYAAGRSGFHEHNLYPLRYNRAVAEVTERVTGERIAWSRSAWAGSQRYPLHWGGDPETTNGAMAGSLRGGLSLGLCGFPFWGHFIGGFAAPPDPDLYLRWLAFGVFSSHTRCHGTPPREPWEFGQEFAESFRRIVELRYRLLPYIYAQAKLSSETGHPVLRTLFFEYPEDPTGWTVEDEYMFGEDILVAPLFEEIRERPVYLPPGSWVEYFSGKTYGGSGWHRIRAGEEIPAVVLVRYGAAIPHAPLVQHTGELDWGSIELCVYGAEASPVTGRFCRPEEGELHTLRLERADDGNLRVTGERPPGSSGWTVREVG
ncbi:alpha-xylosidase, partial [Rubrobacter taiwanensis]